MKPKREDTSLLIMFVCLVKNNIYDGLTEVPVCKNK